jgi:hypothetical protein
VQELFPDVWGNPEIRPDLKEGDLFPDNGREKLGTFGPARPIPEEG